MIALDLISNNIPPLKPTDSLVTVMDWMREFRVVHLPVIEDGKYLGLISEDDLLDVEDYELTLKNLEHNFIKPHVQQNEHIYEIMQIISEHNLTTIPVLDETDKFLGIISLQSLINFFAEMSSIKNPGSILVLSMKPKDYSLFEIARHVESNDASILSAIISKEDIENELMELTLKINQQDLSRIIATFERYDYIIKKSFQETEYTDIMKDRFDSFMNWMDI